MDNRPVPDTIQVTPPAPAAADHPRGPDTLTVPTPFEGNLRELQSPLSPYVLVERAQLVPNTKGFVDYELPKTVASARDGWQWTSQSGAVVSGLLAAVAAQLLGVFKDDDKIGPSGAKSFLVATCYFALFLNINATIGSFVLVDNLGEVGVEAAKRETQQLLMHIARTPRYTGSVTKLLEDYGASRWWPWMLVHWLFTFYLGILSLIIAVLTYVMMSEPLATKIVMGFTVGLTLLPTTLFILRGLGGGNAGRSNTRGSQHESEAKNTRRVSQDQPIAGGSAA